MPEEKDYTEQDLEDSLRRAFVDKGFESILFDGCIAQNEFLREGISHGVSQGWLFVASEVNESQYTAQNYKLTDEGKRYFGLAS